MRMSFYETKIAAIAACVTGLLFCSGFLVIFTPFPLYFVMMLYGKNARFKALLFTFAGALIAYLVVFPVMYGHVGDWSLAKMVYLVPGAGIAEKFSLAGAQLVGLIYLTYFLLFGFLFGEALQRKWALGTLFSVSVGSTFAFLVIASAVLMLGGVDIVGTLHNYMSAMLTEIINTQDAAGINSESVFALKQNAGDIVGFSMAIIPAVVFLTGLIVAFANYVLGRWLVKAPLKFAHLKDLTHYCLPHYIVWVAIMLGFGYFADNYFLHNRALHFVTINGLIALSGVYFLQGILIVAFYLRRMKGRIIKLLMFATLMMFIQVSAPIIALIGFADLWIDFRRLVRKKEIPNQRSVTWK
jgi:hypothetical protein